MRSPVLVIGHVDHGKTALVRALTGMETDRLPEEKARGLSITPGFARLVSGSGQADVIDVPGHEDFIAALVRAASGAGSALLVVSAPDGPGPQSFEHARIIRALGLRLAGIALTKRRLVPAGLGRASLIWRPLSSVLP